MQFHRINLLQHQRAQRVSQPVFLLVFQVVNLVLCRHDSLRISLPLALRLNQVANQQIRLVNQHLLQRCSRLYSLVVSLHVNLLANPLVSHLCNQVLSHLDNHLVSHLVNLRDSPLVNPLCSHRDNQLVNQPGNQLVGLLCSHRASRLGNRRCNLLASRQVNLLFNQQPSHQDSLSEFQVANHQGNHRHSHRVNLQDNLQVSLQETPLLSHRVNHHVNQRVNRPWYQALNQLDSHPDNPPFSHQRSLRVNQLASHPCFLHLSHLVNLPDNQLLSLPKIQRCNHQDNLLCNLLVSLVDSQLVYHRRSLQDSHTCHRLLGHRHSRRMILQDALLRNQLTVPQPNPSCIPPLVLLVFRPRHHPAYHLLIQHCVQRILRIPLQSERYQRSNPRSFLPFIQLFFRQMFQPRYPQQCHLQCQRFTHQFIHPRIPPGLHLFDQHCFQQMVQL